MSAAPIFLVRHGANLRPLDAWNARQLQSWPEGRPLKARLAMPRRLRNHNHFFAVIAAAATHWPDGAEPEPEGNVERLRAWLLIDSGYADHIDFPVEASDSVVALIARARGEGRHQFVKAKSIGGEIVLRIYEARSISWDTLEEVEFRKIKESVFASIHAICGVSADDLIKEQAA